MRERITFSLDKFWAQALRREAEKAGQSLSGYLERTLRHELVRQAAERHNAFMDEHYPTFYEDAEAERAAAEEAEARSRTP